MNDKPNGRPRRPRKSREDIPPATAEHVDAGVEFLDGVLDRMSVGVTAKGDIDGTQARFVLDGDGRDLVNGGLGQGNGAVVLALETLLSMSLGRLEGGRPSVQLSVAGAETAPRETSARSKSAEPRAAAPEAERAPRKADRETARDEDERPRDAGRSRDREQSRDRDRERPKERSRSAKEKVEREGQLGGVAQFLGQRIAEIGVPVVIMGMDSFDRRIIHQNLGDQGGMETASEGFGSFRRLKIRSVR